MNTTVTLDNAGRVLIPKALREDLQLDAGDTLQLDSEGDRITLHPLRSRSPLRKEQGIWVFRSGGRVTAAVTDRVLSTVRGDRDRANRGRNR